MSQLIEEPRLFENLCSTFYLGVGFELVRRNRGAPGIDGVSIHGKTRTGILQVCADDCNIFVKSQKAAERVMETISRFIEKKLKLKVNQDKSKVALSDKVKFLGFTVVNGTIAIAHKALQTAMDKVKALTPRGTHKTLETNLKEINQWYVGWANYYSLTYYPSQLRKIEAHIWRRLWSRLVYQQKRKKPLYHSLVKRGCTTKTSG